MQVPTVRVKDGKGSKVINREDYDADSNAYELMEDIGIAAQPDPEPEVEEVVEETAVPVEEAPTTEAPAAPDSATLTADAPPVETEESKVEEDLGALTIPELTDRLEAAGVDIETIVGTGSNDRVVKLDLVNAVKAAAEAAQE